MPPPLKNVVTSEHEEILWNSRHLSTDTSIGLIQAVIFYLIKSFGLWQGKDMKLLKTEHVTFSEDELGKFVTIDIKMAVGVGKVVKRYDDPGNPRSVYKILKTYKGYLANEGPFLVRPISSIKDYICYSPWPLGLNIIEQTVVNLMQECGIGSGFGNVSVCLMAIDTLKSFGAGSHCISTWLLRLYPRYKKSFWVETFKECSTINCEDKNQEACLVISHLLDPPYPATTMLVEMRKKQEMLKHKMETMDAQRSNLFDSWLSNINRNTDSNDELNITSKRQKSLNTKINSKTKTTLQSTGIAKDKSRPRTGKIRKNLKNNSNEQKKSSLPSSLPLSTSSSPLTPSNITVKTEIMTDVESTTNNSKNSDMRITTVLSIPESAFSAQVDEGECVADDHVNLDANSTNRSSKNYASDSMDKASKHIASEKTVTSGHNTTALLLKRKLKHSKSNSTASAPGAKQSKIHKEDEKISESSSAEENVCPPVGDHEIERAAGVEANVGVTSFLTDVKREGESSNEMLYGGSEVNIENRGSKKAVCNYNSNDNGKELPENISLENRDQYQNPTSDSDMNHDKRLHLHPSPSDKVKHEQIKTQSPAIGRQPEVPLTQQEEESQFAHILKASAMTAESLMSSSSSSSSQSSFSTPLTLGVSPTTISGKTKDSIEFLRKLLQKEGKSSKIGEVSDDIEREGQILCNVVGLNSLPHRIAKTECTETSSSSRNSFGRRLEKVDFHHLPQIGSRGNIHPQSYASILSGGNNHTKICNRSRCTNVNPSLPSAEPECIASDKELAESVAADKPNHFSSDIHPATDMVKFLDAANVQLQNILQVSCSDLTEGNEISKSTPTVIANFKLDHLSKESASFHPPKLSGNDNGDDLLKISKSRSKSENSASTDFVSDVISSQCCHSSGKMSAPSSLENSEPQNSHVSSKDIVCPLLRSVLESPKSPSSEAEILCEPPVNSPLHGPSLKTSSLRNKKRFAPVKLKTTLTMQTQFMRSDKGKGFCGGCTNKRKPYLGKKNYITLKKSSKCRLAFKNGKACLIHNQGLFQCAKNCQSYARSCCHSHHSQSSLNPSSSSLLLQESEGSSANSGIYYYRSNHHENAAYQTLQIKREDERTQTFTVSDLPLDVPDSGHQEDYIGMPTSEICLGDYFPEGTVLPVKDMKLLTRQGSRGLEVVLKFEYRTLENSTQTKNRDIQDKEMEIPAEQNKDSTKIDKDTVNS